MATRRSERSQAQAPAPTAHLPAARGTLTLANSAVVNNSNNLPPTGTGSIGFGGGISNITGALTIRGCSVSGNTADLGYGGGIYNGDPYPLTVTDSNVSGNTAEIGGGIINDGPMTVDRSTVSGNTATGFYSGGIHFLGEGGGISNSGTMTVSGNTTISGNSADLGGGIFSDSASSVIVRDTVFTANSAIQGGGIYNNSFATLEIQNCTFSGNNNASDSGGAIYNLGTATLQECTLSGNTAANDGGGIFNGAAGTLTVMDSTVLNNAAPSGADIYNLGVLTLEDTTVGVIGRLMALALRFETLLGKGEVASYAELARLGHVSCARISQILNLLHLAPDLQEELLFLTREGRGRDPIHLARLQPIAVVEGAEDTALQAGEAELVAGEAVELGLLARGAQVVLVILDHRADDVAVSR
jgi:hypothetical protein